MTTDEPETLHTVVVLEELHLDDPGLHGYVKAVSVGDGWEFTAAIRPDLESADREGTLDWIMSSLAQFVEIGPARAGWFPLDDRPGWHVHGRRVLLPSLAFLAEVDLDAERSLG